MQQMPMFLLLKQIMKLQKRMDALSMALGVEMDDEPVSESDVLKEGFQSIGDNIDSHNQKTSSGGLSIEPIN